MRAARLVQMVLLGLLTVIGLVATLAVVVDWLQGLDTWLWEESTCTIESSEAVVRPERGDFDLRVSYRYRFRDEPYLGDSYRHGYDGLEKASEAERLASRYAAGSEVRCWVDPDEPGRSYLRRADLWQGSWILVSLVFVAVGAGGLWLVHGLGSGSGEDEPAEAGPMPRKARLGVGFGAMIVFFGVLFLFGAGVLVPFFVRPALQVLEARAWTPVPCEIVSSRLLQHSDDDGTTYSIDALFRYELDGRAYRSNRYQFMGGSSSGYERKARIVEALPAGATTTCWVDPDDPFEAVIERGFTGDYLFGLVPLLFALIGIGGLAFAIAVLRSARQDAARPSWTAPAGPGGGSALAWRARGSAPASATGPIVLEPIMGPFGKLGCAIAGSLFWNGFIAVFVWHVVQDWRAGNPQWFPALILTPFVLVGLLLLSGIPYSILALLNPRPRVHVTPGTLQADGSAQLEWAFRGFGSRIRRLRIWLEATETRVREGESGIRIETAPLDTPTIEILDRGRELPLEYGAVSFTIPPDTPPSSEGDVSIFWKLKLRGDIAYWPDVNEAYEIQVLPGHGRQREA